MKIIEELRASAINKECVESNMLANAANIIERLKAENENFKNAEPIIAYNTCCEACDTTYDTRVFKNECPVCEIHELQAEIEEYRIASLQLADNAMKFYEENQQLRNFHNEQSICAEEFAKIMAENVLLRNIMKKAAEGPGKDWLQLQLMLCDVLVKIDKGEILPQTAKIQADLEYKSAIDEALVVNGIGVAKGNPKEELHNLIIHEIQIYNDPLVSEEAAKIQAVLDAARKESNIHNEKHPTHEDVCCCDLCLAVREWRKNGT